MITLWPKSVFSEPGLFFTDGLKSVLWQPENIIDQAADSGFKWVTQEIGDPATQPDDTVLDRMKGACRNRGLKWGIWEDKPRSLDNFNKYSPDLWILNVEDDYFDYGPLLRSFRLRNLLTPAGVVTNCGLNQKPFIRWNIKAMPEAYQQDPAHLTPATMVARCKQMGWRKVFPVLGMYHAYPLANYVLAGDGYSIYITEGMQTDDWLTAVNWNMGVK